MPKEENRLQGNPAPGDRVAVRAGKASGRQGCVNAQGWSPKVRAHKRTSEGWHGQSKNNLWSLPTVNSLSSRTDEDQDSRPKGNGNGNHTVRGLGPAGPAHR